MRYLRILHLCAKYLAFNLTFLTAGVKGLSDSSFFNLNVYDLTSLALSDIESAKQLESYTRSSVTSNVTATAPSPSLDTIDLVQRYLHDFKDANGLEEVDEVELKNVLANPISVYRLIRRCHLYMTPLIQWAREEGHFLSLEELPPELIPQEKDLREAIKAILVVQSMYNFNVTQFADGNIRGLVTKPKLRGVHCVEIGTAALRAEMYVAAVEWFQEGGRRAMEDRTVSVKLANEKITEGVKAHDEAWRREVYNFSLGHGSVNIYFKPLQSVPAEKNIKVRNRLYSEAKGLDFIDVELNSWGLCAGEDLQSPKVKAHLFCWHEFQIHPFFQIGPLKMEFLARQPDIIQIYNVLFAADLKELTLTPGTFTGKRDRQEHLPSELELKIAKKFGLMVGLNVPKPHEDSRVKMLRTSYSFGYGPLKANGATEEMVHVDESVEDPNDFFATVLAYLNDVDQGGNTAFPASLTFAEPIRGSAIFYFNVFADGSLDRLTLHFGCPVVVGQKWIVVNRMTLKDQFLKKPCPLRPKERFEVPVNGQFLPIPTVVRKNLREEDEFALNMLYPGMQR